MADNKENGVALDHSLFKFVCYHQLWVLFRLFRILLVFALFRPQRYGNPSRAEPDANGKCALLLLGMKSQVALKGTVSCLITTVYLF